MFQNCEVWLVLRDGPFHIFEMTELVLECGRDGAAFGRGALVLMAVLTLAQSLETHGVLRLQLVVLVGLGLARALLSVVVGVGIAAQRTHAFSPLQTQILYVVYALVEGVDIVAAATTYGGCLVALVCVGLFRMGTPRAFVPTPPERASVQPSRKLASLQTPSEGALTSLQEPAFVPTIARRARRKSKGTAF